MAEEPISQLALSSPLVAMQNTSASPAHFKPSFQYDKLDIANEEIRVLVLHPKTTESEDEPIVCSLVRKRFGEIPAYEALSYMWGDQNITYSGTVKVNGCLFPVGKNLGCALARLRTTVDRNVWIDAICINQKDDQEKSLQIQLMPHIYKRAKKCLIWLGEVSIDLEASLHNHPWNWTYEPKKAQTKDEPHSPLEEVPDLNYIVLEYLVTNPYWQRVWIIQEIGLARKLDMLCGSYMTTFSAFISQLRYTGAFQDSIPMRLQTQLDTKYQESHDLQFLIESHQENLCQEPRDHIYGFVGLSADGMRFPIDYSKTHYQVWRDAVLFKSRKSSAPQSDLLSFAALVKKKLGAPTISNHEVVQDSKAHSAKLRVAQPLPDDEFVLPVTQPQHLPDQIVLASRLAGCVAHIGPTCADIIAFPRTTIDWRFSIYEHVEIERRPQVREESDLFLEKLEGMKASDLALIENYDSSITWKYVSSTAYRTKKSLKKKKVGVASLSEEWEPNSSIDLGVDEVQGFGDEKSLFLMNEGKEEVRPDFGWNQDFSAQHARSCQGSMGILPSGAREGDYLYRINGISRAIVIRRDNVRYRIIGTAVIAGDLERARGIRDTADLPFHQAEFDTVEGHDVLILHFDVAKVYRLLD